MKSLFILVLTALFFLGCEPLKSNGTPKEKPLAKIGNEFVYDSDIDLLTTSESKSRESSVFQNRVTDYFLKLALTSKVFAENPELDSTWKSYHKIMEYRFLANVLEKNFVKKQLTYSMTELENYYKAHEAEWKDSSVVFRDIVEKIARKKFLEDNDSAWTAYFNAADSSKKKTPKKLQDEFINNFCNKWMTKKFKEVQAKHNITTANLEVQPPEEYYKAHKKFYKTREQFELYQLADKDSSKLVKKLSKISNIEDFKLAKGAFYTGFINSTGMVPHGVGLLPKLVSEFQTKNTGEISSVYKAPDSLFYAFALVSKKAKEEKSFDRAQGLVKADFMRSYPILPSAVLASDSGKPFIFESDILAILDMSEETFISNSFRNHWVKNLIHMKLLSEIALELNLQNTKEFNAYMRLGRVEYALTAFQKMKYKKTNISEDSLFAVYERIGNPFRPQRPFMFSQKDLIDYLTFPSNILHYEFNYMVDLNYGKPLEDNRARIILKTNDNLKQFKEKRAKLEAWNETSIEIYDSTYAFVKPLTTIESYIQKSDSLYKERKVEQSYSYLKQLRLMYPENDSLFADMTFKIADMQSEFEAEYDLAQAEYRVFFRLFPNDPRAEKAMFGRGFILMEYQHKNNEALEVFEEFLRTYPESSERATVEWFVKDLKSNGKLSKKLSKLKTN